jgi:voltage-gated potassium channel
MFKNGRFQRFATDVFVRTPFVKMVLLLLLLWLVFAAGLFWAEQTSEAGAIRSFGGALYWGVAAFSTAGIAETPQSGLGKVIGGLWIVIGSGLFFGTIVATITTYFSRPLQRPARQIVESIEYNLEQLDDLSVEEIDLLKKTTDTLLEHMERLKESQLEVGD